NDGNMIFHGNFLCAEILLTRYRKPGAGFDGSIIGHDNTLPFLNIADYYHYASRRTAAVLSVHSIAGEGSYFNPFRIFIEKSVYPLPGGHFSFLVLFFDFSCTATFVHY